MRLEVTEGMSNRGRWLHVAHARSPRARRRGSQIAAPAPQARQGHAGPPPPAVRLLGTDAVRASAHLVVAISAPSVMRYQDGG